jgi:hypothetical protein
VFSVSIKDRGAILPGGRLGKAFWYSSSSGEFVSSTYYYDDYPAWVAEWNAAKHADQYMDATWELVGDRADYIFADADDRARRGRTSIWGGPSRTSSAPRKPPTSMARSATPRWATS